MLPQPPLTFAEATMLPVSSPPKVPPSRRWHLRRWFVQGLLISLPIGLTVYFVLLVGRWVDGIFNGPIHALFGVDIPGLGTLLTLVTILGVGFLASHTLSAWIFERINAVLERIPVFHSIYSTIQETVELLLGGKDRGFRSAVLVPQNGAGAYVIGLVTRDELSEVPGLGEDCLAVYVPMAYNIGGFTYVVPRDKLIPLPELSPQQALRFAMAGGVGSGRHLREKLQAVKAATDSVEQADPGKAPQP